MSLSGALFSFLAFALGLLVCAKYKSKKVQKDWKSDYEKYQEDYRSHIDIDSAIDDIESRYSKRKKD